MKAADGQAGSGRANKLFQYVDQPGCRLQYGQTLRQFFSTINIIEQLKRPLVTRMSLGGFAEKAETG